MKLFDSHAHLDMKRQSPETVAAMIHRAFDQGLEGMLVIAGADAPGEYETTVRLLATHPRLAAAAGIHPHAGSTVTVQALNALEKVLHGPRFHALGEIGLDYHYNYSPPEAQRRAFISQLRLAHKLALPVIVHTRQADEETIAILRDEGADRLGGVIHCFSGGEALAQSALELGFYISFSGIVTFPRAEDIRAIARSVPSDRILAETDTPFLAPVPHRGRTNEPAWVRHVVETLAKIRGVPAEEMAELTTQNCLRCFCIDPTAWSPPSP